MGTTCTPTPPGCVYADTCPATDPSVAEACINFCAPVFEGPVIDDGVFCALDECDQLLFTERSDIWRCPPTNVAGQQYVCEASEGTPDPARIGVCRAARGVLDLCFFADPTTCEAGSYCVDVSACPTQRMEGQRLRVPDGEDFCWLPAREGEPCDSNLGRGAHGCSPCEWGTWCRDTPTYGPICMRACATPDEPATARPDLCACTSAAPCQAYADIAPPDPRFPVESGEPAIYCTPLFVPNGNQCRLQGVPCGDATARCQETFQALRGKVSICCRDDGAACTSPSDCCEGRSTCFAGQCTPCGLDGEVPSAAGCCPGHVVVDQVCRSCSSSREGRDHARLDGASCEGDFVQLLSESGARQTFVIPVRGSTSAGPAEMPLTSGRTQAANYQLRPGHRLFLMEGDLTGTWSARPGVDHHPPSYLATSAGPWPEAGVTVGHRFVQLPPNAPGSGPVTLDLSTITMAGSPVPASTWQSLRVYDAGACSSFQPWANVTDLIVASLNRFLVEPRFGIFGSTPLTLLGPADPPLDQRAHITPILASAGGGLGRSSEHDQLGFFVGYRAIGGEAFGCSGGTLWFSAGFRILRDAALAPTLESEDLDRVNLAPHDFINDGTFCLDGDCHYCEGAGECPEVCAIDGARYHCQFYVIEEESSFGHFEPRPVRVLRDAFDYRPVLTYLRGGMVDCAWSGLNDLLSGILAGKVRQLLPGIFAQLTGQFTVQLPNAALGVRFEDLTECSRTLPSGEVVPSDALCSAAAAPLFGNRRLRCVGFDADDRRTIAEAPVASYRCADLIPEVRRVNLRPDGAEVVLSDSTADPQHPLVAGVLPPGFCAPFRPGSLPPTAPAQATTVSRGLSQLSTLPEQRRRICHPDDPLRARAAGGFTGCEGMCGDIGVPCIPIPNIRNIGPDASCYATRLAPSQTTSFCCAAASFCPMPESAGGLRFFDDPVAPDDPPAHWTCVDLNRNALACGACGVSCAAGETCCGGSCSDPSNDSINCGSCGNVCAGGAPCLDGVCCGAGEVICAGACADLTSSSSHCGACGSRCERGAHCSAGNCCPDGQEYCGGACIDVLDDRTNCGGCGRTCNVFFQHCSSGRCCLNGFVNCGDAVCRSEEDLAIDPNNCGGCGNACRPREACIGGRCVR